MADSDKSLSILIQLGVIGKEDAAAVKDLLAQTKDAAGDLNQAMPAAWAGMDKYKEALKGAGEGVKSLGGHVAELRALMTSIGPGAGELGHLLDVASNPALLSGALLAEGLKAYFHWLDKSLERQKEMNAELAKHNDFLHQAVKLQGDMHEQANLTRNALAQARAEQDSLTQQLKAFEERAKIFNLAQDDALANRIEQREAESTILGEQIQMLESLGKISKPQADQEKLNLEHQAKLAEIWDKVGKAQSDYDSAKSDRDEELKAAGGAGAFSPDAIAAATAAAAKAKADLAQAQFFAGAGGVGEIARLQQMLDENKTQWHKHGEDWDPATGQLRGVAFHKTQDELLAQIEDTKRRNKNAENSLSGLSVASAAAAQHLKDIQNLADKFHGLDAGLSALHQKLTDISKAAPAEAGAENQRAALASFNEMLNDGQTPQAIWNKALSALDELNSMKSRTGYAPEQYLHGNNPQAIAHIQSLQSQVAALGTMETAVGNNGAAFVGAINSIIKTMGGHEAAANALKDYASDINHRLNILAQQLRAQSGYASH
jgi:hypothetical protein